MFSDKPITFEKNIYRIRWVGHVTIYLENIFTHFPNACNFIATELYYKFKSAVTLVATDEIVVGWKHVLF